MNSKKYNKKTGNVCDNVFECYTSTLNHDKGVFKLKSMEHRGISDIIAVLLLLGITVAGAVLVSAFFQGNNIFRYDSTTSGTQTAALKITGYDTRDGSTLSRINTFDNTTPGSTLDSGTDFIVLTVLNQGINKVVLQGVEINDITHSWDNTQGDLPSTYPAAGKFNIIPIETPTVTQPFKISSTNEIDKNQEVRLVIKLSASLPDISLNEPMRVKFYTDLIDSSPVVITSGGVR